MINQYLLGWVTLSVIVFIVLLIIKKNPSTKYFLITALFLRSFFSILGEFYITLPGSSMDAWTYEQFAFKYSQEYELAIFSLLLNGDSFFLSKIISIFYTLFDRSPMMANMFSVGFGTATVFLIYRFILILWSKDAAIKAGWFAALFPSLILYSTIIMRETYVIFFLTYGLIGCVNFINQEKISYFIKAILGFFLSALFHGPMIIGLFVFLIYIFFKILKSNNYFLRFKKKKLHLFFLLPIISIPFITYFLGYYSIPKIGNYKNFGMIKKEEARNLSGFEEKLIWKINKATIQCHFEECKAAYPTWLVPKDKSELLYLTPLRMVYFLYSPFPWDIKSPKHLIGLLDAILYLYLSICAFQNRKFLYENSQTRFLFLILISYVFIYSFGVGNFGTGIRHRLKFIVILIAIAAPTIKKIKFKK